MFAKIDKAKERYKMLDERRKTNRPRSFGKRLAKGIKRKLKEAAADKQAAKEKEQFDANSKKPHTTKKTNKTKKPSKASKKKKNE